MPPLTRPGRSARFRTASDDRFWWHRLRSTDYVPPLYAGLSRREWAVVEGWFAHTRLRGRVAEINVPAMSLVTALVAGNGIRRVVQLGHYYGYSALLLGFTLRAMGARPGLFTIDKLGGWTTVTKSFFDPASGVVAKIEQAKGVSTGG